MLSKIPEKYKFYLLSALLLIVLIVCYKIAFKSTFEMIKQSGELKSKEAVAADIQAKTALLSQQLKEMNSTYFNENKSQLNTHELILEKISSFSYTNSVKLVEFPSKQLFQKATVEVETHTALLSGRFTNLLQVVSEMELYQQTGRMVSVGFYAEEDRKTKTRNLYSRLYIQNYRNLNDNEN
jgi:hypothetical protein